MIRGAETLTTQSFEVKQSGTSNWHLWPSFHCRQKWNSVFAFKRDLQCIEPILAKFLLCVT
jgi:hypothetical protein